MEIGEWCIIKSKNKQLFFCGRVIIRIVRCIADDLGVIYNGIYVMAGIVIIIPGKESQFIFI